MNWLLVLLLSAVGGADSAAPRHSVLTDQVAQDEVVATRMLALEPRDEPVWLDGDSARALVVCRRASPGEIKGTLIVLAEPEAGPEGPTHSVRIRHAFALHGWHTCFARLPVAEPEQGAVAQRIEDLVGLLRKRGAQGALVLVSEGAATHWAASVADQIAVDGLVLINVPESSREFPFAAVLLEALALPSLVLQEYPHDWRKQDPLGNDVELHLLPAGSAGREDNRLLRKIRGWFKRRFEAANV